MCTRGGFRLHKFMSNSKEVVESTAVESRAKEIKELDLIRERVLGVEWNIENDAFQFRINLKDKSLTRRGILSTVSSIYDPLGFATSFLLREPVQPDVQPVRQLLGNGLLHQRPSPLHMLTWSRAPDAQRQWFELHWSIKERIKESASLNG